MKKRLFVMASITILLLSLLIWPMLLAKAQSPYPQEIDDIGREKSEWWPKVVSYQVNYNNDHDHYYQMLWNHTRVPSTTLAPDNLGVGPSDQIETGYDLWLIAQLPGLTRYRLRIDVYEGPAGPGFVLILQTVVNGQLWQRSINYGPETSTEQDWTVLVLDK